GILYIPKRTTTTPVHFKKNGPQDKKNKCIFSKEDTPIRYGDDCTTAHLREHWEFLYSARDADRHFNIEKNNTLTSFLENNLPPREIVCNDFIGRDEELSKLWGWLGDRLSNMRLLAGEGGLGKTSIAYEFAESICSNNPLNFEQVIWLSAKQKKFIGLENKYINLPEVHFSDYTELLKQLSLKLGSTDSDFEFNDEQEYIESIIENLEIIPSFIVIDDLDSLEIEDQKRTLESILTISSRTKSRFLLTTRKNIFLAQNAIEVKGLIKSEYEEFINNWCASLEIKNLKHQEIRNLRDVTNGSPLFTESILRLIKLGLPITEALNQWKNAQGEEVRKAALEREIGQLTDKAKKVLVSIAILRECSYRELCSVTGYPDQLVTDSIAELSSLFLISAPKISNEPRYKITWNTRALVLQKEESLVNDTRSLRKNIKELQEKSSSNKSKDNFIGNTIQQAMAQLQANHISDALESAEAALKQRPQNHDLLLLKARCLHKAKGDSSEIKKLLKSSYNKGNRKEVLLDIWFEIELENSPSDAVDVASKALESRYNPRKWHEAKGIAIYQRAAKRNSRMHQEFIPDFIESIREFKKAAKQAKKMDFRRLNDYIETVSKTITLYMSSSKRFSTSDISFFIEHLYKIYNEGLNKSETITQTGKELFEKLKNEISTKKNATSSEIRSLNILAEKIDTMTLK
ncbi:hypothetical protein K5M35_21525, partial [Chromobacterium vaccinii]|nr:hypothetical protein [Chromobacterium vaccinii]